MNNNRFLKVVIVILILINAGTLVFMWINRPQQPKVVLRRPFAGGFIVKELGLSESQKREYAQLRREHVKTLELLQENDRILHDRFFGRLFAEVPDMNAVHDLADSIAMNRRRMEILTYEHFEMLNNLLNPEQQKKFRDIFDDVLRIVLPPPPNTQTLPGPPPPPPPPPANQKNQ